MPVILSYLCSHQALVSCSGWVSNQIAFGTWLKILSNKTTTAYKLLKMETMVQILSFVGICQL